MFRTTPASVRWPLASSRHPSDSGSGSPEAGDTGAGALGVGEEVGRAVREGVAVVEGVGVKSGGADGVLEGAAMPGAAGGDGVLEGATTLGAGAVGASAAGVAGA